MFYERAIQNVEQQLQAFQRSLDEAAADAAPPVGAASGGLSGESESESEDDAVDDDNDDLEAMEADRGEAAVAEYMHRCPCALAAACL